MVPDLLQPEDQRALLTRLGVEPATPSFGLLAALQTAWCFAQPFHNIDLLAASRSGQTPLGPAAALSRCLAGLGGPCHVQSSAFLALLRSLGFDSALVGAAVTHEDDHLLVRTVVDGSAYYSDVGNGQPYLTPFPADRPLRQSHLGWVVDSRPDGDRLLVERVSPDQPARRRVYRAAPSPRAWSHFAGVIERHHAEPGFGPFLTGLRAVRISSTYMITIRDHVVTRYHVGRHERTTLLSEQIAPVLSDELGLGALPIAEALAAWPGARA